MTINPGVAMGQHIKILGVLHIIFGGLGVLAAIIVLAVMGGIAGLVNATDRSADSAVAVPILALIGIGVFVLLLVLSLPGIIAGFGLLQFRPWARILTIVLSALELINIPFGTALGIYGLWVLLNRETEQLFQQPPRLPVTPHA
ncbi:MAG TPA: hypothetical protein VEV17_12315 [Bryobacteraceae bacterium]|nr:hypothetical protein [Bryobacteraceae bacterium]